MWLNSAQEKSIALNAQIRKVENQWPELPYQEAGKEAAN